MGPVGTGKGAEVETGIGRGVEVETGIGTGVEIDDGTTGEHVPNAG